jgi:hypothetical protein
MAVDKELVGRGLLLVAEVLCGCRKVVFGI